VDEKLSRRIQGNEVERTKEIENEREEEEWKATSE
jgi:hypothetical protein